MEIREQKTLKTDTVMMTVLQAADRLDQDGQATFTAEELTVEAWRENSNIMGLAGFADDHPDHHKSMGVLSGQRGLVSRGFLDLVGRNLFAMADLGRQILTHNGDHMRVPAWAVEHLEAMLQSPVWSRWRQGMVNYLKPAEASTWTRLGDAKKTLATIRAALVNGRVQLPTGQEIDYKLVSNLVACDEEIRTRFSRQLGK